LMYYSEVRIQTTLKKLKWATKYVSKGVVTLVRKKMSDLLSAGLDLSWRLIGNKNTTSMIMQTNIFFLLLIVVRYKFCHQNLDSDPDQDTRKKIWIWILVQ
jgi:hypothetical protein